MTINGRRSFTNNGRRYYVQNNPKYGRKRETDNYYLTEVDESGAMKILYENIGWEIPKFETIKEAQRYVRDWDFMLETM